MVQQELIEGCKNGDRKAQRALYDQYSSRIYGCCLKYAPNAIEAQDILQDSFITIYNKIEQYDYKGSFEGWCKRIAINTALQRYRTAKIYSLEDQSILIEDEPVEVSDLEEITLKELLAMIQHLPDRYRMVFSLHTMDGYNHKEIAAMMGITEGTSKSNLSRARQNLQQMINEWREKNTSNAG